jgi:hypothetical protein
LTRVLSPAVNAAHAPPTPLSPSYDGNARDNAAKYEVFEVGVNVRLIKWLDPNACFVAASGDTVLDPQWVNIFETAIAAIWCLL